MFRKLLLTGLILMGLTVVANGDDLYKVVVSSQDIANHLNKTGVEAIAPIQGGYLFLADTETARILSENKIELELIAPNIEKQQLMLDQRMDGSNIELYNTIYEEDNFRLFLLDSEKLLDPIDAEGLIPIDNQFLQMKYFPSGEFDMGSLSTIEDLQTLIDLVVQDSLESYDGTLQSHGDRYYGTASNYTSRHWLVGQFTDFGYDSIVIDSFVENSRQCMNVIAYKIGTMLPDHHVIVGAHRDAVSGSPGADDNGSGSSGVLECARILKDYQTDLTFVFILFDSEEQGLNGAYHYANAAAARGDSIVFMLNMDMIAHYQNSINAKLYHGSQLTYTELFQHLADSLLGLNCVLSGSSGGSDHYPFSTNGYEVSFLHEYIFSTVYHSYQDSTSYMNFTYMTKMVKAALATAYSVCQTYIPGPSVAFNYPDGLPDFIVPNQPTSIEVVVDGLYDGVPVPGTGQIHYAINGGAVTTDAMSIISSNRYSALLPPTTCGDELTYYISAEEATSGRIYDTDPGNPHRPITASSSVVIFADDFESLSGWTVSGGLWARGIPTGNGGAHGGPDPTSGNVGSNVFGYNLNGDYENGLSERHLTSPVIDCSGLNNIQFSFWRWLGVEQPSYDHAYIRISTNGSTWTTLWENSGEVADYGWKQINFDISAYADNQATVYLRWTMGTTDGSWTYCGWNIDGVVVNGYTCDDGPAPLNIVTDDLPDWTEGHPYNQSLLAAGGTEPYGWADKYNDLSGTGLSLASSGIVSGTPNASAVFSFTAEVTDDNSDTFEKILSVTVNNAIVITTTSLPDGITGEPYSQQLAATGGTGGLSWIDRDDDLSGTGLSLSSTGLLSGTVASDGSISFTARATDGVGSFGEQLFGFQMLPAYICGDGNNDGVVNMADASYVISYIFYDGPEAVPPEAGDANCDGSVNLADASYIINYIFRDGPPSCCP